MQNQKSYVYGIHALQESFTSDHDIEKILIQKNSPNEALKAVTAQAKTLGIPVQSVPLEKLNGITRKNHQGVIAFISPIQYRSLDNVLDEVYRKGEMPFLLILDGITDVRNFGAIVRTAECAGINAIVVPSKGTALMGQDAMKTSSGALHHVPVCRSQNLHKTISFLQQSGVKVIGCTEKTDQQLFDEKMDGPVALVMGSEEKGLSSDSIKTCDAILKLPMKGKISSLNVSVAAGIVMYEVVRQRQLE